MGNKIKQFEVVECMKFVTHKNNGKIKETTRPSWEDVDRVMQNARRSKTPLQLVDMNGHRYGMQIDALAQGSILSYCVNSRLASPKKVLIDYEKVVKFSKDEGDTLVVYAEVIVEPKERKPVEDKGE